MRVVASTSASLASARALSSSALAHVDCDDAIVAAAIAASRVISAVASSADAASARSYDRRR
jgi:hypothetical protein